MEVLSHVIQRAVNEGKDWCQDRGYACLHDWIVFRDDGVPSTHFPPSPPRPWPILLAFPSLDSFLYDGFDDAKGVDIWHLIVFHIRHLTVSLFSVCLLMFLVPMISLMHGLCYLGMYGLFTYRLCLCIGQMIYILWWWLLLSLDLNNKF